MQTQKQNLVFALLKLTLKCSSSAPMLPLISSVGPSPNTKKLFFQLSVWDNELISTPKIMTFLTMPLPKLPELNLPNAVP